MADDPVKRETMLPEVRITGKKTNPKQYKKAMVRLYPKGEVEKYKVDSISNLPGVKQAIGSPIQRAGQADQYGTAASDVIKQLTKRK